MTEEKEVKNISEMNIYEKLTRMQNELLQIPIDKSGKNAFGGFSYYTLDDLFPPIILLCEKYGATLFFNFPSIDGICTHGELHLVNWNDKDDKIIVEVPFAELEKLPKMNWAQSSGTYQTYMKRYLILHTFNIIEDEVIDASNPDEINDSKDVNDKGSLKIKKEKKPKSIQKVIAKCKEEHPEEECDSKLLNRVSLTMLKNKEITQKERKEIFEYLKNKK